MSTHDAAHLGNPRRHFLLAEDLVFLNHGSFGATPRVVLERQAEIRAEMERDPVFFFVKSLEPRIDEARAVLARVVHARPEDVVFVTNATEAVNAVVRSQPLSAGDELLTTSQAYNACVNVLRYVAGRAGAKVVVADVPFPVSSPSDVVEAVLARVTPRTKLALLDHVTSPTGIVWPMQTLVEALEARGVRTLVDGAHALAMVPLDLEALGASYYTANCHKWLCAPKGAAFLWARRDRQDDLVPVTLSHGYNDARTTRPRFHLLFDWVGTRDPSAALCVPFALAFVSSLHPGGLEGVMASNRDKALAARRALAAALGTTAPCPDEMIGSLAAVTLPDGAGAPLQSSLYTDPLQDALYTRHRIQVPIVPWPAPPRRLVRISAQVYNTPQEYELLARALTAELARERSG